MATKVYMEALSPTMEEGRLLTWMKGEGDEIKEGDVLAEVETDKATMELVARGSGVLRKRIIEEGETANVGTLIGVIARADEDISSLVGDAAQAQGPSSGADPASAPDPEKAGDAAERDVAEAAAALAGSEHTEEHDVERGTPAPSAAAAATGASQPPSASSGNGDERGGRVKASPLARRLADEAGVSLGSVQGSGPGGRIVRRDIEAAARSGPAQAEAQAAAPAPTAAAAGGAEFREVPLSQMRKTIAKRLTQSIGPVPHFFLTVEVDMTEAVSLRKKLNERLSDEGIKVSPNDLIIKSVAMALRRHPWVNAAWTGDAIRLYEPVHIGSGGRGG